MNYFLNFINSGDHFSYVLSSYLIVFFYYFPDIHFKQFKNKKTRERVC